MGSGALYESYMRASALHVAVLVVNLLEAIDAARVEADRLDAILVQSLHVRRQRLAYQHVHV